MKKEAVCEAFSVVENFNVSAPVAGKEEAPGSSSRRLSSEDPDLFEKTT